MIHYQCPLTQAPWWRIPWVVVLEVGLDLGFWKSWRTCIPRFHCWKLGFFFGKKSHKTGSFNSKKTWVLEENTLYTFLFSEMVDFLGGRVDELLGFLFFGWILLMSGKWRDGLERGVRFSHRFFLANRWFIIPERPFVRFDPCNPQGTGALCRQRDILLWASFWPNRHKIVMLCYKNLWCHRKFDMEPA